MPASACRLEMMYPAGTTGRKMSSAEMYTNGRGCVASGAAGESTNVSATRRAMEEMCIDDLAKHPSGQKSARTRIAVHDLIAPFPRRLRWGRRKRIPTTDTPARDTLDDRPEQAQHVAAPELLLVCAILEERTERVHNARGSRE
jgi:hypothetical protein